MSDPKFSPDQDEKTLKNSHQAGQDLPPTTTLGNEYSTKETEVEVHHLNPTKEVKKVNQDLWAVGSHIEAPNLQFS